MLGTVHFFFIDLFPFSYCCSSLLPVSSFFTRLPSCDNKASSYRMEKAIVAHTQHKPGGKDLLVGSCLARSPKLGGLKLTYTTHSNTGFPSSAVSYWLYIPLPSQIGSSACSIPASPLSKLMTVLVSQGSPVFSVSRERKGERESILYLLYLIFSFIIPPRCLFCAPFFHDTECFCALFPVLFVCVFRPIQGLLCLCVYLVFASACFFSCLISPVALLSGWETVLGKGKPGVVFVSETRKKPSLYGDGQVVQ